MAQTDGRTPTKLALAALGGAAVVTMTGLSVATGENTTPDLPPVASPVLPWPMT